MSAPLAPGGVHQLLPALWTDAPEEPTPHAPRLLVRLVVALAGLMVLLFGLAALVPIGGAVIGGGQVGVETRVKRIAHPTGGVIAAIAVINGQHVRQGELLMRLDDRVTGADATYSNLTVEQLLAQKARLEAERLGLGQVVFPPELTASTNPSARKAMADEQHLFAMRQTEEGQLRAQLSARVAQAFLQLGQASHRRTQRGDLRTQFAQASLDARLQLRGEIAGLRRQRERALHVAVERCLHAAPASIFGEHAGDVVERRFGFRLQRLGLPVARARAACHA